MQSDVFAAFSGGVAVVFAGRMDGLGVRVGSGGGFFSLCSILLLAKFSFGWDGWMMVTERRENTHRACLLRWEGKSYFTN